MGERRGRSTSGKGVTRVLIGIARKISGRGPGPTLPSQREGEERVGVGLGRSTAAMGRGTCRTTGSTRETGRMTRERSSTRTDWGIETTGVMTRVVSGGVTSTTTGVTRTNTRRVRGLKEIITGGEQLLWCRYKVMVVS